MKPRILSTARLSFPLAAAIAALLSTHSASAANLYWDTNGTTTGSGAATGTWGTDLFWSTDVSGLLATANTATTGLDDLFFSAGTTGTGGTVTVNGSRTARKLTFEEGAITLSGGTLITLAGGGGITVDAAAGNATVSTALTLNGNNTFNVGTGRTLTVNSATFNRSTNRATLNVQGAGTVAVTGGLATLTNDIIGPWASFGTTTGTTYATVSGGNITGLTYAGGAAGTAVTTAANITSNTGAVNYSLSGTTAAATGAGASINTLRYTGSGLTISNTNLLIAKGIMNAGTGGLVFSNAVTAGSGAGAGTSTTEIVVNTANNNITFNGILTGTITKTGSGTMTLSGTPLHAIGGWTVNEGVLILNSALGPSSAEVIPGGTVNSGGTVRHGGGNKVSNSAVFNMNAGGTFDINGTSDQIRGITGAGFIVNNHATNGGIVNLNAQGADYTFSGVIGGGTSTTGVIINTSTGSQTLSGLNTYTGVTDIRQGTLSINSIGNAVVGGPGVVSAIGAPTTVANGTIKMGITTGTNLAQLTYTGTGHTTDRVIDLQGTSGGATINQSGASGLLKFNAAAFTATGIGSKTLTLSGSTAGTGEIAAAIVNNTTTGTTVSTAASASSTALVLGSVDGLTVGNGISGIGIPGSTTISAINTATKTVTLSQAATVAANAVITSAGAINITSLTKSGTGTWTLSGANTYSGATTISAGTLRLGAVGVIPDGAGKGNVSVTGTLDLNGNSETINGLSGGGTVDNAAASTSATLTVGGGGTFSGSITDSGTGAALALVKSGSGADLILSGNNSYSGGTTLNSGGAGRLFIGSSTALPTTGAVQVNSGATLNINASGSPTFNQSITLASGAALAMRQSATLGNVTLATAGSVIFNKDDQATAAFSLGNNVGLTGNLTVQIGGDNANVGAVTLGGDISGSGFGLTKTQTGKLILSGTNTYSGATDVQGGTLAINGSISTSLVTVQTGATLGGNGTITGNVSVLAGGTFAAGNSIDSIAIVGNYGMTNANFGYELDANATAGAEGDLTTVTGNLTLTGTNTLTLTEGGPFGNWTLGSPLGDHLIGGAEKLTLIAYNGTWNGGLFTYLGNLVQDDSAILLNGQQWWFNYNDNDAGINFTTDSAGFASYVTITVPEPNVAALFGGLGMLALLRRRR